MTDKVQKIRNEVKKLKSNLMYGACSSQVAMKTRCKEEAYNEVLSIMDSMQEEPKECMYARDNYTDEDRKTLCDGCEEECRFNKKEEPVNDSFEAEVKKLWMEINTGHSYSIVDSYNIFYGLCMDIADWQKEQQNIIEPTGEGQVKESLISKHDDKTCKENGNSLTQEPISDDLEEAIDTYLATYFGGEKEKQEWPFLKKMAIHFAEWQKEQFENNRLKHCDSITNEQAELEQGFIDQHLDKYQRMPTFLDAIEYGMRLQKAQLMKNAIDTIVKVDAGGYPYVDRIIELYDYDREIPLAKKGDKYKIILIK